MNSQINVLKCEGHDKALLRTAIPLRSIGAADGRLRRPSLSVTVAMTFAAKNWRQNSHDVCCMCGPPLRAEDFIEEGDERCADIIGFAGNFHGCSGGDLSRIHHQIEQPLRTTLERPR
jgi:hypothetical protein